MITRGEPLVNVFTPVYNGEEFLCECIESVLAQTYRNFSYTIVNNKSTDRSLEIALAYAGKDSRVRVVSNETFVGMYRQSQHRIPHDIARRQVLQDRVRRRCHFSRLYRENGRCSRGKPIRRARRMLSAQWHWSEVAGISLSEDIDRRARVMPTDAIDARLQLWIWILVRRRLSCIVQTLSEEPKRSFPIIRPTPIRARATNA